MRHIHLIWLVLTLGAAELPGNWYARESWSSIVRDSVTECLEASIPDSRFVVDVVWIPPALAAMDAAFPTQVGCVPGGMIPGGLEHFEISLLKTGNRYPVQVRVQTTLLLPVPKQAIERGEIIRAGDVELRWIGHLATNRAYPRQVDQLHGLVARADLPAGQPIHADQVRAPHVVRSGDRIRLTYEENGIRIEISGVARQDAAPGDVLRVTGEQTRRTYLARVEVDGRYTWIRTL
jgi:flagella basal body P-ring formation protein FlgA